MKHLTMKFLEVTFFAVAFVICKEVGTKPQYFYPGYPFLQQQPVVVQRDNCGWLGCVDQTIVSIGSSVISGVNGTLLGIGSAATGIANGTSALVTGAAIPPAAAPAPPAPPVTRALVPFAIPVAALPIPRRVPFTPLMTLLPMLTIVWSTHPNHPQLSRCTTTGCCWRKG